MANRVRTQILAAYAAGVLTTVAIGLAGSPEASVAPRATNAAESLLTQMSKRSPGTRTADELTKTKDIQLARSAAPLGQPVSAVPEPDTWAMMLVGFGFIGFSLRRRRARLRSEAAKA